MTMNRTYSMRQPRASNSSTGRSSAPPTSSTKTSRLFGKGSIVHSFRRSTAGAFAPDLAKKLSQLVKMEKNLMRSMEQASKERRDLAHQLSIWGEGCEADISDITDKLGVLIYEIGVLEDQYIDHYDQYRVTLKSIRNIESSVQPCRDRRQRINDQIAHLKLKDPDSPKLVTLEQELVRSEAESLVAEAQLSNITREKLKNAFTLQFDALQEHCQKVAIIAGYGKHLLELVDDSPVTPGQTRPAYDGKDASKSIIQDCEGALSHWESHKVAIYSPLSRRSHNLSRRRRSKPSSSTFDDSAIGSWEPDYDHGTIDERAVMGPASDPKSGMLSGSKPAVPPRMPQEQPVSSHFSDSDDDEPDGVDEDEDEDDQVHFSDDETRLASSSKAPSEPSGRDRARGSSGLYGSAAGIPA